MEIDRDELMNRRGFLRTAAGTATVASVSSTAAAQESSGGGSSGGTQTVAVGAGSGTSFDPEELTVSPGTTVTWQWTGEGGAHNVVADGGAFDSGDPVAGSDITFKHTFKQNGEFPYHCEPHQSLGMVGTIIVGQTSSGSSSSGSSSLSIPDSAKTLAIAAISFMISVLGLGYFFMKYGGDYGQSVE